MHKRICFALSIFLISTIAFSQSPYNIILIINDQETFKLPEAKDYSLPARATLMKKGVTFKNHYTAAAMCSPSRATFLTGVPPQINGVFDQMEYSYVPSLNPNRANIGSVLKHLGYRTAYFGKFEMDKTLLTSSDTQNTSTLAKAYGFDVFNPDGDVGGTPQQGYSDDVYFVGEAIRWLRNNVSEKNTKPFFLVISLLNPHDIMYGDANIPGTPKEQRPLANVIMPPPNNAIYKANWNFNLPNTLAESLTTAGMPKALMEYQTGWTGALGVIPTNRKDMWHFYDNYYLNAIRDNDKNLQQVVTALDEMDLWKNTVVILTADHGEMAGAHGGLRGKGPFVYEENTHIPLIIAHPNAKQGKNCIALTSHIDLLPTIVGLTGLPKLKQVSAIKNLPGKDFAFLVIDPETKDLHALRQGILFNYVGISTIDGNYLLKTLESSFEHKPPLPPLSQVNLNKRGFLAFVFDGRYKYGRYYAPNNFKTPKTLDELLANNDLQLFDLQNDPNETKNLAVNFKDNAQLILRMNSLLNNLMAKEVGKNNGDFLPVEIRPNLI